MLLVVILLFVIWCVAIVIGYVWVILLVELLELGSRNSSRLSVDLFYIPCTNMFCDRFFVWRQSLVEAVLPPNVNMVHNFFSDDFGFFDLPKIANLQVAKRNGLAPLAAELYRHDVFSGVRVIHAIFEPQPLEGEIVETLVGISSARVNPAIFVQNVARVVARLDTDRFHILHFDIREQNLDRLKLVFIVPCA